MKPVRLRPMTAADRFEVAELIYASINVWYQKHGRPPIFVGGPRVTEVFYDVYNALEPGCAVVAENPETGRLMGSCFYHPRKHHVSLGIMNVHPNYFGLGVGRALLQYIIDFTDRHGTRPSASPRAPSTWTRSPCTTGPGSCRATPTRTCSWPCPPEGLRHVGRGGGPGPARHPGRRARHGRPGDGGQRHHPRGGLPLLHRQRARLLARRACTRTRAATSTAS